MMLLVNRLKAISESYYNKQKFKYKLIHTFVGLKGNLLTQSSKIVLTYGNIVLLLKTGPTEQQIQVGRKSDRK